MPKDKKFSEPKPIYFLFQRDKMGSNAATEPLTKEEKVSNLVFNKPTFALDWILANGNHGKVYVIRDRELHFVISYVWKQDKKQWGPLNRGGYFGNYKIGNAQQLLECGCCYMNVSEKQHPCHEKPIE